jgi:acyl-CoA reductase-like NAD-dependent aldehyde dehydrogenase
MRKSQQEVFAPVAPITIVDNEEAAIKLVNDSQFGLGSSIWTQDLDKAERLSKLLEVGISYCKQCGHFRPEHSFRRSQE